MSRPSTTPELVPEVVADSMPARLANTDLLVRPVEAVGFWAAVALPFVYVPLLLAGVETSAEGLAVAALVAAHVVALVVGHRHRREE
ncbi:MAG: hypothetical protein ABEJ67_07025 [Halanaeroarchaeum sp.]